MKHNLSIFSMTYSSHISPSALSLRLFGEDITVIAQAATKARATNAVNSENTAEIPTIVSTPITPMTLVEVKGNEENEGVQLD